jgi:NAD(P)H dehydrogenase (quinone)
MRIPCVAAACGPAQAMRILVTGASGSFAGRAIRSLLERVPAADLVLMSRKPERLVDLMQAGCDVRYGDFDEPNTVAAAARGVDKMLLISGHKVGHRVKQHGVAIEAARGAGIEHIVYTSYFGSTAENTALVCVDHHGTELKLEASGVPWTVLRNGMYANSIVDAAFPAALTTGRWLSSTHHGQVSLIDRDDCVACAVAVLTTDGHENCRYDITGTELWSFEDMARLASEVTGKSIEYTTVTDDELYLHLDAMGIPHSAETEFNVDGYAWCSDDMVSYEREVRAGSFAITSDDVRLLSGQAPKPFRAFVEERADWLRQIVVR